jgi:hypothetical protein
MSAYADAYDGIVQTMQFYIDGCREGKSALMRPAFHPNASFIGYAGGGLVKGPDFLFDWVDRNGPSPGLQVRFASVTILHSIAAVHLEVENLSGNLAGSGVHMSDLFTLLHTPEGWKITEENLPLAFLSRMLTECAGKRSVGIVRQALS